MFKKVYFVEHLQKAASLDFNLHRFVVFFVNFDNQLIVQVLLLLTLNI